MLDKTRPEENRLSILEKAETAMRKRNYPVLASAITQVMDWVVLGSPHLAEPLLRMANYITKKREYLPLALKAITVAANRFPPGSEGEIQAAKDWAIHLDVLAMTSHVLAFTMAHQADLAANREGSLKPWASMNCHVYGKHLDEQHLADDRMFHSAHFKNIKRDAALTRSAPEIPTEPQAQKFLKEVAKLALV
jgi:hypothetical protein